MDETTTPPTGPSPDVIFKTARAAGFAIAKTAMLFSHRDDPTPLLRLAGVEIAMWSDGVTLAGATSSSALIHVSTEPGMLMRLSGVLAGIADAYRLTKKEPSP